MCELSQSIRKTTKRPEELNRNTLDCAPTSQAFALFSRVTYASYTRERLLLDTRTRQLLTQQCARTITFLMRLTSDTEWPNYPH